MIKTADEKAKQSNLESKEEKLPFARSVETILTGSVRDMNLG